MALAKVKHLEFITDTLYFALTSNTIGVYHEYSWEKWPHCNDAQHIWANSCGLNAPIHTFTNMV